jgi:elongation factor Ts
MAITADQVKLLRDKTGVGMMDCKKALTEANGDFDKAIEILRKKGAAVAAKRAERTANEGIVLTKISEDKKTAFMVEVNCETDFVARSDDFINFSNLVLDAIVDHQPKNIDELMNINQKGKTVNQELENLLGRIGEKVAVSRFVIEKTVDGMMVDYVHHGSKLGVLVRVDQIGSGNVEEMLNIEKDVAMQVAAMKPIYVYREEVPKEVIEKEIEIIALGKLTKYYQENCLFEQAFIKDNTKVVSDLFKEYNKRYSANAKLMLFHRYHLSDEKK